MGWIKHSEDKNLPEYLKINLPTYCIHCGTEKLNYYNSDNRCTNRKCPNPVCSGTLGRKIAEMCDILKWEGIGDNTGRKLVLSNKLTNHFDAIPFIYKHEQRPNISLGTLFRLAFIEGIDKRWEDICNPYGSVTEVLEKYKGEYAHVIQENKELLLYGEKFFDIKQPDKQTYKPVIIGNVMISGTIKGFNDRNSFIAGLNMAGDGLISLRVVGKRKTDVMALIQEADSPNQGKAECALENGIPIMTPEEFKNMVFSRIAEKLRKGEVERR